MASIALQKTAKNVLSHKTGFLRFRFLRNFGEKNEEEESTVNPSSICNTVPSLYSAEKREKNFERIWAYRSF